MPTNYLLTISFDEAGLRTLREVGQNVGLVRCVEPEHPEQLAWLSFFPRLVSTITWTDEDVHLYAFLQAQGWPLQPGTAVYLNATSGIAAPGDVFEFSEDRGFQKLSEPGSPDQRTVIARGLSPISGYGLAQAGTLFAENEPTAVAPLNVYPVPSNTRIPFRLTQRVQIFTVAAAAGVILGNEARGEIFELELAPGREAAVRYDSYSNRFVLEHL